MDDFKKIIDRHKTNLIIYDAKYLIHNFNESLCEYYIYKCVNNYLLRIGDFCLYS